MSRIVTPARAGWALVVALAVAFPYLGASRFALHLGMLVFIWSVVASYWNLLNGFAGILSLGNVGFFALGAYFSAVLSIEFGWSPLLTMVLAGAVSMVLVTVLLGLPVLRLRGIYIALLTLVFVDALPSIVSLTRQWTGGGVGLLGIPPFIDGMERWQAYYIALVFCVIAHIVLATILRSSTGLAFVALRDSEDFAVALGVDRFREGVKVFAISSLFTAWAGAIFAHTMGQLSPGMLAIDQFVMVLSMWLLGGVGTFAGPLIGALIVTVGNEYLRVYGSLRLGILGALIVLVVLFFPRGFVGVATDATAWLRGRLRRARDGTPNAPVPPAEEVEDSLRAGS
jgi:branched-chain amino acid transport system permease protein